MAAKSPKTSNSTNQIERISQKDGETDMLVMTSDLGKTRVSEEVVGKIAGLAVKEVEGVHALVPFGAGQTLSSIAQSLGATNNRKDIGVHVEVGQVEAAVDVRIVTDYGVAIPQVAEAIRTNIARRIEVMTGLKVKEINIDVVDLFFEADERPAELPTDPRVR